MGRPPRPLTSSEANGTSSSLQWDTWQAAQAKVIEIERTVIGWHPQACRSQTPVPGPGGAVAQAIPGRTRGLRQMQRRRHGSRRCQSQTRRRARSQSASGRQALNGRHARGHRGRVHIAIGFGIVLARGITVPMAMMAGAAARIAG